METCFCMFFVWIRLNCGTFIPKNGNIFLPIAGIAVAFILKRGEFVNFFLLIFDKKYNR